MKKSGLGDSPFFFPPQKNNEAITLPASRLPVSNDKPKATKNPKSHRLVQPNNRGTMKPRYHDTTMQRYHESLFETVRKAVKEIGKEAATHRFTQEEKRAIADIIYSYKNNGIKTSENEIARISVNFILEDYRENGENSILDKVLRALNE